MGRLLVLLPMEMEREVDVKAEDGLTDGCSP